MSYTRRTNIRRVISKTTITSLVVSMTLAACAVGPNYTPPRSEPGSISQPRRFLGGQVSIDDAA